MATLGGARALGLEKAIGSLEAGKRADLIVVAMDGARQTPMYNPVSHLVYVTRGDDVRTTIVNGRVLMRDRRMRTLDERVVLADARALAAQGAGGGRPPYSFEHADVRQVAVLLGVVEAVAHHEPVLDREADVLHLHVDRPAGRLAEQARRAQRLRAARAQDLLEVGQRQAGVHDVLDDDHVACPRGPCRGP